MSNEIRSCEDALRFLAAHLDGELDDGTSDELKRHLDVCRTCFSRAEFERRLKEQISTLGSEPVRPEFRDRLETLIGSFRTGRAENTRGG